MQPIKPPPLTPKRKGKQAWWQWLIIVPLGLLGMVLNGRFESGRWFHLPVSAGFLVYAIVTKKPRTNDFSFAVWYFGASALNFLAPWICEKVCSVNKD